MAINLMPIPLNKSNKQKTCLEGCIVIIVVTTKDD